MNFVKTVLLICVFMASTNGYVRDNFTTNLSAGSVNGTSAQPGPGTRIVSDTGLVVKIDSSKLKITSSGGTANVYFADSMQRISGAMALYSYLANNNSAAGNFGPRDLISNLSIQAGFSVYHGTSALGLYFGSTSTYPRITAYSANTMVNLAHIFRNNGQFVFVKKPSETWKLRWVDTYANSGYIYWYAATGTSGRISTFDNVHMSKSDRLYIIRPYISDAFNMANGLPDTTDGFGHQEANGGSGKPWSAQIGTWGIVSNKLKCNVLPSNSFITTESSSKNNFVKCDLVRSSGSAGIVLRYVDTNNYVIVYHDGTNAKVDKKVAGTTSSVLSTAIAYSAGSALRVFYDSTEIIASYNNTSIGIGAITDTVFSGAKVGLFTTDTGSTFDNFVSWSSRGYSDLDSINYPLFTYPASPKTCLVGEACTLSVNATRGGLDSFVVSPELPAGLLINQTTGKITGTPTIGQDTASYTITAFDTALDLSGSATAKIVINYGDIDIDTATTFNNFIRALDITIAKGKAIFDSAVSCVDFTCNNIGDSVIINFSITASGNVHIAEGVHVRFGANGSLTLTSKGATLTANESLTIPLLTLADSTFTTVGTGKTITLTSYDIEGSAGNLVSWSGGTLALSAVDTVSFMRFTGVTASPSAIYALDGTSVSGGGNTNIFFSNGPDVLIVPNNKFDLGLGFNF